MNVTRFVLVGLMIFPVENPVRAQETPMKQTSGTRTSHASLLKKLSGKWEGKCKTWFEPDKLADESTVAGEMTELLDGRFLRHTYEGTIRGKPRRGEELIAFNSVSKKFQTTWVDDFHMNYGIMFSEGEGLDRGFVVRGEYDVGEKEPQWGWKTEYVLVDENTLRITAFNIHPEGMEFKAVETTYRRLK